MSKSHFCRHVPAMSCNTVAYITTGLRHGPSAPFLMFSHIYLLQQGRGGHSLSLSLAFWKKSHQSMKFVPIFGHEHHYETRFPQRCSVSICVCMVEDGLESADHVCDDFSGQLRNHGFHVRTCAIKGLTPGALRSFLRPSGCVIWYILRFKG